MIVTLLDIKRFMVSNWRFLRCKPASHAEFYLLCFVMVGQIVYKNHTKNLKDLDLTEDTV